MKYFLLSIFILILSQRTFSQLKTENFNKIIHIDKDVYEWDWGAKPFHIAQSAIRQTRIFVNSRQTKIDTSKINNGDTSKTISTDTNNWKKTRIAVYNLVTEKKWDTLATFVYDSLVPLLGINHADYNESNFKSYLDRIKHIETISWLEFVFRDIIKESEFKPASTDFNSHELKAMLAIIHERIDEIMRDNISMYRFTETSKTWIRGIYVDHSNDFLSLASRYNDDRDMTGAFRMEIATDLFKMRILDGYTTQKLNLNNRNIYSYQTLFFGGEGYTPYLRDTSIFNSNESVDSLDRPYAAFQYIGRAKYRVSRHGRFRMFNQFKIGSIGSLRPGAIQSIIHRDVVIGSFTPKGWGAQIAAGGRIGYSLEYFPEWMLTKLNTYSSINFSGLLELKYGTDMTSAGAGINYCNKGFLKSGGINLPFIERSATNFREFFHNNIIFNVRTVYRRVIHNTMLEGYGITQHQVDEDPNSPVDKYYLQKDQVERNVFISEFSLNIRFNYCGLIFKQTIMSPEFILPVNSITYKYGEQGAKSNHNTSPWNHYGTIGFFFLLK